MFISKLQCPYVEKRFVPSWYHKVAKYLAVTFDIRLVWITHCDGDQFLMLARICPFCKRDIIKQYGRVCHLLHAGAVNGPSYIVAWEPVA
jgi:hypothetical protein